MTGQDRGPGTQGSSTLLRWLALCTVLIQVAVPRTSFAAARGPAAVASVSATPRPPLRSGKRHLLRTSVRAAAPPPAAAGGTTLPGLASIPVRFEPNVGQVHSVDPSAAGSVQYVAHGPGYLLWLTSGGDAVLAGVQAPPPSPSPMQDVGATLPATATAPLAPSGPATPPDPLGAAPPLSTTTEAVVRFHLAGANPAATTSTAVPAGTATYLVGSDATQWQTGIATSAQVTFHGVLPGVDLLYDGTRGQLETTYTLAAGVDPTVLDLQVQGAGSLSVDGQGALHITVGTSVLVEQPPLAYQVVNGQQQPVTASYALSGTTDVGFLLGPHDATLPVVIDPILSYSTFLGGSGDDEGRNVQVDSAGNAYLTGLTASTTFPTTTGVLSPTFTAGAGASMAFVTKVAPGGGALVWSTYLGGTTAGGTTGDTRGRALAVDASGSVYVTGFTTAKDFPTKNAAYSTKDDNGAGTNWNVFLSKLNATGTALLYSSYYGGSADTYGYGLAADASGHAYVTGWTTSQDFPTTAGALQATKGCGVPCTNTTIVVAKIDTTQTGLASVIYATFWGGSGNDSAYGITIDAAGDAYVVGSATSDGLAIGSGYTAYQPHPKGPQGSAYLVELNPAGTGPLYATYYGSDDGLSIAFAVTLDGAGDAYVAGRASTADGSFPTKNAFQSRCRGTVTAFVAEINPARSGDASVVFGTFFGGSGNDYGYGLGRDGRGDLWLTGKTTSRDLPLVSPLPGQSTYQGGADDAYVSEFSSDGRSLLFSSYLGGSGDDIATGLAVDSAGSVYVEGQTNSSATFPTTAGAISTTYGGGVDDVFLSKVAPQSSGTVPWHPHSGATGAGNAFGLSVDLADGHADVHTPGLSLPSCGPDLTINRTWDSTSAAGRATNGWTTVPSMGGVLTGTVLYTDTSGAVWGFPYAGSPTDTSPYTTYQSPPGQPWQLTAATGGYTLTNVLSGEVLTFTAQGARGAALDSYGNTSSVTYNAQGQATSLTSSCSGRTLTLAYDGNGRLSEVQSPLWQQGGASAAGSQHVTYGYNAAGQVVTTTWGAQTTDALTETFGYSGTQLVTVTTPIAGHVWQIGYDSVGRVVTVTSPVSGTAGQAGYTPHYSTTYSYGPTQTVVVQGAGTSAALAMTYTLDSQGQATAIADGLGDTSRYSYDADHDVLSSTDPTSNTTTDSYQYVGPPPSGGGLAGSIGQVTQTVAPPITPYSTTNAAVPVTTTHRYDAGTHDLTQTVLPEGGTENYQYNGHHDVTTATALLTGTTQWRGSLTSYNSVGLVTSQTDGRGVTVSSDGQTATATAQAALYTGHTTYSSQNDLAQAGTAPITTTTPAGTVQVAVPVTTTYQHDADGQVITTTTPNSNATVEGYDHLGRVVITTLPSVTTYTGQRVQPVETTGYDGEDHVVTSTDALSATTLSSYDPLGRLVAMTNPVSGTTLYTYTATEQQNVQDPVGNVMTTAYDAAGRPVQSFDPLTGTVQTQYDAAGNTTVITSGSTTNGAIQVETRGYDTHNRVVTDTVTDPTGATPPNTTITSYDKDGNLYQQVSPNGDSTVHTYDKAGQLVSTEINTPTVQVATHQTQETYGYDPAGNVTQTVDYDQRVITATYDGDNRLQQSVAVTITPGAASTITTTPQYDPNGNVLTQTTQTISQTGTLPPQETHTFTATFNAADWTTASADDGQVTQYGYDAAGQLRTKTLPLPGSAVTYTLDAQGRATSIAEGTGAQVYTSTFAYNANDLPLTVTMPGGVIQTAQYDADSRITRATATGPAGVPAPLASSYVYGYNPLGWTTSLSTSVANLPSATYAQTISHDALGRITSQRGGYDTPTTGAEQWFYDATGNITQTLEPMAGSGTVSPTFLTYDPQHPNELIQQHTVGLGTEYRTYDARGNTTAISSTDKLGSGFTVSDTLGYDAQARPLTITTLNADSCASGAPPHYNVTTFGYNSTGQRDAVTLTPPAGCPQLTYSVHMQYRADGELGQSVTISGTGTSSAPSTTTYTDTFVYDQGGQPLELLRQQNGATSRYWYTLDGRNNVVALTSITGTVVNTYTYELWGEQKVVSETVPQPLRYDGYWFDVTLGWYWLSVRSYDPEGQFLQPDPSEIEGSRSYVYVGDDPVDATDPSGLCFIFGSTPCHDLAGQAIGRGFSRLGSAAHGALLPTVPPDPKDPTIIVIVPHKRGKATAYMVQSGSGTQISLEMANAWVGLGIPAAVAIGYVPLSGRNATDPQTTPANSGLVTFRPPPGATDEEIAQVKAYCEGCNVALVAGLLSPTGRVSTKGTLSRQASKAAALERVRAAEAGTPYEGHAGHVPDTTWTGNPNPHRYMDLTPKVNTSLGGQSGGYEIGYEPTGFVFEPLP